MSIQYIIGDVFENIDTAAFRLRVTLEHMLDVLEQRDTKLIEKDVVLRPLCVDSGLDFITSDSGKAIGPNTTPRLYHRQLALCDSCGFTEACLAMALTERRTTGIWGGGRCLETG